MGIFRLTAAEQISVLSVTKNDSLQTFM